MENLRTKLMLKKINLYQPNLLYSVLWHIYVNDLSKTIKSEEGRHLGCCNTQKINGSAECKAATFLNLDLVQNSFYIKLQS